MVVKFTCFNNLLTRSENTDLLLNTIASKDLFTPATTATNELEYRRSLVLYTQSEFNQLITDKLTEKLPEIFSQLGLFVDVKTIESQVTAHGDGCYYKVHNDNGSPGTVDRRLSYVYYFYLLPKQFTGGELLIYGESEETLEVIDPVNNSLICFPSSLQHEVMPVTCYSDKFDNYRFTVNGWIRGDLNELD